MNLTRDARRDQVVAATLKLIGKHGIAGLTTASLAREVGMSEANLYRHFKNKQEILSETVARIEEGLRDNVGAALRTSNDPIDRLRKIYQLHLRYVSQNRGIPRLVFSDEIHADNTRLRSRLMEMISAYARLLESIIAEAKEQGSIKEGVDVHATALSFIGMIQVTILCWVLSGFKVPIEEEGAALWDNFESCTRS